MISTNKLEDLHSSNMFALQQQSCESYFEEEISRIEFLEPNRDLRKFLEAEKWYLMNCRERFKLILWSYLSIYNFSSLCLIHLAALGGPMCLEFLCLIFFAKYVFAAFSHVLPVKLPVLCSKCWRPRIPRHHFQWCRWCSSSSSPSTPREETLFNKDVTVVEPGWYVNQCERLFCLTWRHPRRASSPGFHRHMQTCSLQLRLAPAKGGI